MRLLVLVMLAACGASPTPTAAGPSSRTTSDAECTRVARHLVAIGPVDQWIAEGRKDGSLPVGGVSDRAALEKFFDVGCRENWDAKHKRCVLAQPTWEDVGRECADEKVWWYQPT